MKNKHISLKRFLCFFCVFTIIANLTVPANALQVDKQALLSHPELCGKPIKRKWYQISPEGAVSADGKQWHGLIRMGNPDKVIVYFNGGGACVDSYSAFHPITDDDANGFYYTGLPQDFTENFGFLSKSVFNPFNNWTVLLLSYTTGDFHIGSGSTVYTDSKGNSQKVYHNGYINYKKFMDIATGYLSQPEKLIIAGSSAGGFGASLLADDIISNYFPEVKNTTVLVDASLLISDNWKTTASNLWHAPEHILKNIDGNNITLSALKNLASARPYVKILFDCSVRDGELTKFQNYLSSGVYEATEKQGDLFQSDLNKMVKELKKIPNSGVFIWDKLGYNKETNLTQHTNLLPPFFYIYPFDGVTMSKWVCDAVNGRVCDYGIEKTEKIYS